MTLETEGNRNCFTKEFNVNDDNQELNIRIQSSITNSDEMTVFRTSPQIVMLQTTLLCFLVYFRGLFLVKNI